MKGRRNNSWQTSKISSKNNIRCQPLKKLRDQYPETPVVLMSGLAEEADVNTALKLGAAGYFPKTLSGKAVLQGIQDVLNGDHYVAIDHNTNKIMRSYDHGELSPSHSEEHTNDYSFSANISKDAETLTPREREVLGYLLKGSSNKDITRALDLQVVTVKLHVRGICRKLGAKNRTQAALIAQQNHIV